MGGLRRIVRAVLALALVTLLGTVGYLLLGFTPLDAVYQTVTTVATVGFREVNPLTPAGQLFICRIADRIYRDLRDVALEKLQRSPGCKLSDHRRLV